MKFLQINVLILFLIYCNKKNISTLLKSTLFAGLTANFIGSDASKKWIECKTKIVIVSKHLLLFDYLHCFIWQNTNLCSPTFSFYPLSRSHCTICGSGLTFRYFANSGDTRDAWYASASLPWVVLPCGHRDHGSYGCWPSKVKISKFLVKKIEQ